MKMFNKFENDFFFQSKAIIIVIEISRLSVVNQMENVSIKPFSFHIWKME